MTSTISCLVTGGAGFIGSHIVDALVAAGHHVTVVDNLSTGDRAQVNSGARFIECDICSPELAHVFAEGAFEVVYHLAAQTDVMTSVAEPAEDARINIVGGIALLEQCRTHGVRKVIYSSSSAVFGEPDYLPMDEAHPIRPLCPYAASKHTFEHYLELYHAIHDLDYTVLRYANAYGPRQDPHHEGGVVAIFAYKLLSGEVPVVYGDGQQTRDFVHVTDLVRANLACIHAGDNACYNLGTGIEITVNQLTDLLCELTGAKKNIHYVDERRGEMRRLSLDSTQAQEALQWVPKMGLRDGVQSVVDFFRGE